MNMYTTELTAAVTLMALGYLAWRLGRLLRAEANSRGPTGSHQVPSASATRAAGLVQCLHCRRVLRIGLPPRSNLVRCPQCGRRFAIVLWDSDNNLYLSPADQDPDGVQTPDDLADNEQVAPLLKALGLEPATPAADFSLREVRKAYYQTIQRYHPDKYAQLPAEFRRVAERKMRELHLAYHKLMQLKHTPGPTRGNPS